MKAVQISAYGGNEVLEVNENAPKPVVGNGRVLVEVYAASINPFDAAMRSGYTKEMFPLQFPATLGGDFAGVVMEVGPPDGEEVSDFKAGDEVYGQALLLNGGSGSFAQFAAAKIKNTATKPKNIDFLEAASLPLVGASALQALEDHIKLKSGDKILIHGGAGGIGSIAVQLAKVIGAYVATTVSAKDVDFVKKLGSDEIIDFRNESFEEILSDFDAVFDTAGGDVVDKSFKILKPGGVIVSMKGQPNEELAKARKVTAIGQFTNTTDDRLKRLAIYVESEKIKPQVDKVFPLDEVKEAFRHLEESHPRGKVVLRIK